MSYTLDPSKAREAGRASKFISSSGKYKGIFTRAEKKVSQNNAEGIEFDFESADGQKATITVWTKGRDGSELFGVNFIHAMMSAMKIREIHDRLIRVKKYDHESKSEIDADAQCYESLMGKPIGIVIQMEEYENQKHEIKEKPSFFCFFDPLTELTSSEILDKAVQPLELAQKIRYVSEVPVKTLKKKPVAQAPQPYPKSEDRFDDDIPF